MVMAYNTSPLSGLASAFQTGMGIGSAFRQRQDENAEREAVGKLLSGDDSGWTDWGKVNPQAAINAYTKQQKLNIDNTFGVGSAKGETLQALALVNDPNTPEPIKKAAQALIDVRTKDPNTTYTTSYNTTRGKNDADEEQKKEEKQRTAEQTASDLGDTISFVESLPESIVGPYAGVADITGALTTGDLGFSDEEQMLKGELDRRIGEIENKIIAVARQNGQTGINTMAEIKQAAKGIASAKSKFSLLGALKHMHNLEQKYIQMGKNGTYDVPQKSQEVISFENWMKQGK